jgi:cytochrome c-type biogenesis protein CcmH
VRARALLRSLATAATVAALTVLALAAPAGAAAPKVNFNELEPQLMCVSCNVPLNIAESPQASQERAEVKSLIAQGLTEQQIKDRLVSIYGKGVLADPPTGGFDVTTWLVPVGLLVALLALGAVFVPRWRRGGGGPASGGGAVPAAPEIDPADARRLDEDLARYDA